MPRAPRTLDALLAILQTDLGQDDPAGSEALARRYHLAVAHGVLDWTSLPTFGGGEPNDTDGVWSWDPTRLLVGSCAADLVIVPRVIPESDQSDGDGAWLRQSRDNLGLTQVALAEQLGITANTVARIERDELPLTRVTRLAVERLGLATDQRHDETGE